MMTRQGKKSEATECRQYIIFQQPTKTKDAIGGFTTTWLNFIPQWSAVLPMSAEQRMKYRSVNVETTHIIKTRGYLTIPTNTKYVGDTWTITWTAFTDCTTVKIEYSVNGAAFVSITASTTNDGSHNWTVPTEAIGERTYIRVTDNQHPTIYTDTEQFIIFPVTVTATEVNETHRILWGSRIFEIITIEDLQEMNFVKLITCKERR